MDNLNLSFLKETFKKTLHKTNKTNFILAISGGIDSTLMLKIASLIKIDTGYTFRAIHINHNYSSNAKEMENHCIDICHKNNLDLTVKNIKLSTHKNTEDQLRNKRYESLLNDMYKNEALVLGHHENDQFETFLYRLFRGSSPKGLSAIKKISMRNNKVLCRPFLQVSKNIIINISKNLKLAYINDHTNSDLSYDRNYIRKKIIPTINNRWKTINNVMNHNIELQNNYSLIVNDYCEILYSSIIKNNRLSIDKLLSYPNYLYSTFLRHWLSKEIQYNLSKNETYNLLSILESKNNDYPKCILKNKISIIRYNNYLHIVESKVNKIIKQKIWDLKSDIGFGNYEIKLNKLEKEGILENLSLKAPITLKSVTGNEKILLNKTYYQELKKIFQKKSIPVWERDRFILFYSYNELLLAYSDKEIFISSEIR
jgi:tRNA(Ile)-lysidine synthase